MSEKRIAIIKTASEWLRIADVLEIAKDETKEKNLTLSYLLAELARKFYELIEGEAYDN